MAKRKRITALNGLSSDPNLVLVRGLTGDYYRQRPKPGKRRNEPAFKEQYLKTGSQNTLAGKLNRTCKLYSKDFLRRGFYFHVLQCIKETKSDSRYVRLSSLVPMDAHPVKTIESIMGILELALHITPDKKTFTITVPVTSHPSYLAEQQIFRIRIILLYWLKDDEEIYHKEGHTQWIDEHAPLPLKYDIKFEMPEGITEFLMMSCVIRTPEKGGRLKNDYTLRLDMAGSFSKKSIKELADYKKNLNKKNGQASHNDEADDGVLPRGSE